MKFLSIFVLIVVFLLVLTRFQVVEVAAADDVKFRGTVLTDEDIAFPICYFMPYCYVLVEEILHDPQDLLDLGVSVSVCYTEIMNLTEYERVEVYGFYFEDGGPALCSSVDMLYANPNMATTSLARAVQKQSLHQYPTQLR